MGQSAGIQYFENEIRPLLVNHCYQCHGEKKQRADLRVDSLESMLKGGERGPSLKPGDADGSLIMQAVRYDDPDLQMPPRKRLPAADVAKLEKWISAGAPAPKADGHGPDPTESFDLEKRKTWWSLQPVGASEVPGVKNSGWARNAVDRFILAKLEEAGLEPAADVGAEAWYRRVSLVLTGLPPARDEVRAFIASPSKKARERVVDRMLASPHFGERWARHWLDLVRYAETKGHEYDFDIPNAHEYRDYVIRAFNADVPYNRFLMEHVAGDLLPDPRRHPERGWDESVIGTGFWYFGEDVHSPVDTRLDETERHADRIDTFSKTFTGMTVACARCHDHKFDAISQKDYYALAGFLRSSTYRQVRFETHLAEAEARKKLAASDAMYMPKLRSAVSKALLENLKGMEGRLLRAAKAMRDKKDGSEPWKDRFKRAAAEKGSPLLPWALWADKKSETVSAPEDWVKPSFEIPEAARRLLDANDPELGAVVDGHAWGSRPIDALQAVHGVEAGRPVLGVSGFAAWWSDPRWGRMQLAKTAMKEPAKIDWFQAGKTIHSRTSELRTGKLWYLVRGQGIAYACVDSHRMNSPPLHTRMIRRWSAGPDWTWIEHDLSDYAGRRVQIDFTPGGDIAKEPLAIALVIESDEPPVVRPAREMLARALQDASTPKAAAKAVAEALRSAARGLADGFTDRESAELCEWLLSSKGMGELMSDTPAGRVLSKRAEAFVKASDAILEPATLPSRIAPAMVESNGIDEEFLVRGSSKSPRGTVPRRFLEAVDGPDPIAEEGSGRLELARSLVSPRNPLVARVFVNRVWHHLFGRGIVKSVDDFGAMGTGPTHPELLDWLAHRFVTEGWSTKKLIRFLVLSRTWGLSGNANSEAAHKDPTNQLLHRAHTRRLEAEAIRDGVLAVSGQLDPKLYGQPIPIHLTDFHGGRGRPRKSGPVDGDRRRSIYLAVRRNFPVPFFHAFDVPPPAHTAGARHTSNVPAQALVLMNGPFVKQQAEHWAKNVIRRGKSTRERVSLLFADAFGRGATSREISLIGGYVRAEATARKVGEDDPGLWSEVCHSIYNLKEFVFLP